MNVAFFHINSCSNHMKKKWFEVKFIIIAQFLTYNSWVLKTTTDLVNSIFTLRKYVCVCVDNHNLIHFSVYRLSLKLFLTVTMYVE